MPTKRMRRFFAEAAAVLLLAESARAKLLTRPGNRRLRALESVNSTDDGEKPSLPWNPPELMSMGSYFHGAEDFGSNVGVLKKSSKSSKSQLNTNRLTGIYFGFDTEDASTQALSVLCSEETPRCDVTLHDSRFSTCEKILGADTFNTGVAIAENIKVSSLNDFPLKLYCMQENETVIDFSNDPTTELVGNIQVLQDGGLLRTGPEFLYSNLATPTINDVAGKNIDINDKQFNLNGRYKAIDFKDGSQQDLYLICTKDECDVTLYDTSFRTCKDIYGVPFFFGVGLAKSVPRTSLDDFVIELYCINPGETIDSSTPPDANLTGNLAILRENILLRTALDFVYQKVGPANDNGFSIYDDYTDGFFGIDEEDGSIQGLNMDCSEGLCDISLQDSSFSTCIEQTGGPYLGGLALAKDVPQDALYDFELELYCATNFTVGINYTEPPVANLSGSMAFLQGGIVRRTDVGLNYASYYSQNKVFNGFYTGGVIKRDGGELLMEIFCGDGNGMCRIIFFTVINPECIAISGRVLFNGIAVNRYVPEDSLGGFDIGLYCAPPGAEELIDYETPKGPLNSNPLKIIRAKVIKDDLRVGIVHVTLDDEEYMLFKSSVEYISP